MAGKLILWVLAIGAVAFALMGGEYSSMDLWRQRTVKLRLAAETDSLARAVDSLKRAAHAVETGRATQERIAREQFGMVKGDKEVLYRFGASGDSVSNR